jgi:DHA1 family bicyclomycin/chloramphenicol resistance-like MFS transporter
MAENHCLLVCWSILASLGCVLYIRYFIVLRFIQAIGSCAATVASVSMVRDLFPVRDIPKVFSLLMLVVGLSPMLAPTVGIRYSSLWLAWFS